MLTNFEASLICNNYHTNGNVIKIKCLNLRTGKGRSDDYERKRVGVKRGWNRPGARGGRQG